MKVLNDYEGGMKYLRGLIESVELVAEEDDCDTIDADLLFLDLVELQRLLSPAEE